MRRVVVTLIGVFLLPAVTAQPSLCSSITVPAPSGASNDITYEFNGSYACGQYVNGDWWVATGGAGENLELDNVLPETTPGRNGWEVNPTSTSRQPYDDRINSFDAGLAPALPYSAAADSSIIKTVSVPEGDCRPCLQFANVLTVVATPPADNAFRPGYFATGKKRFTTAQLRLDDLPKLPVARLTDSPDPLAQTAARFRHVQLDHKAGWTGRPMHPIDNMPGYGASIATGNAAGILRLLLDDVDFSRQDDLQSLVNLVQSGIDLYQMAANGMRWDANGGHLNGRKLPLLLAAILLNDSAMLITARSDIFSENQQIYFSPNANAGAGLALYGLPCSDAQYWQRIRFGNGKRSCRDPYGFIDGGGAEIGGAYQVCCTAKPWKYTALAVRLLQAEERFDYWPLLDYVDRWAADGAWALPDPCAPYDGNPDNHGVTYGPDGIGSCIRGAGRFPTAHGRNPDSGSYSSGFGEDMWRAFRACTPNCPGQSDPGTPIPPAELTVR